MGQCEISHPVPDWPSISVTSTSDAADLYSPIDGMGETISQRNNVMYDRQSKDEYRPLPARITRACRMSLQMEVIILVTSNKIIWDRTVLYQRVRARNPSVTQPGLYLELVFTFGVSVFVWVLMDQVGSSLFLAKYMNNPSNKYSIIPCLAIRGVATAIARSRSLRAKVLLRACIIQSLHLSIRTHHGVVVNAQNDRETDGYTAVGYIKFAAFILHVLKILIH